MIDFPNKCLSSKLCDFQLDESLGLRLFFSENQVYKSLLLKKSLPSNTHKHTPLTHTHRLTNTRTHSQTHIYIITVVSDDIFESVKERFLVVFYRYVAFFCELVLLRKDIQRELWSLNILPNEKSRCDVTLFFHCFHHIHKIRL